MKAPQQPAHLSIFLLGPFQVVLDGSPVTEFESDKARALLAYLAVENERPLRRETLAGLFWPESPERSARTNLRSVLKNVRRIVGDRQAASPCLLVSRQTLQFNDASDAWVDVREFDRAAQAASAPGLARVQVDDHLIDLLEEATAWYRGPFLEGFSLADCPAFEEWALLRREQLQRAALMALNRLATHYEAAGDFERGVQHARRAASLDPWREETQRQLMRLLALSGQRGAALAQYEACRHTLLEELGVEPEEETTALFRRIKARKLVPASAGRATVPNNLPIPLTPFVGRRRELNEIGDRLRDPKCRLLSIVGPGGIGKTRVAIQAAKEILGGLDRIAFSHGVFFVPLTQVRTIDALVPTIAGVLGFSFFDKAAANPGRFDELGAKEQLLDFLCDKKMLLLLDNFEQLLPPAARPGSPPEGAKKGGAPVGQAALDLLIQVLRAAPSVKLLITSRAALNLQPEWQYPLGGMMVPSDAEFAEDRMSSVLEEYSALALFAHCARRICPGFSLAQEKDAVVSICRLVEGMPLAIELAATWLKVLTPIRIVSEIETGLDILTSSLRDVELRHSSMRAVFDHSWNLLAEEERDVLRRLAVFRGGFRHRAAMAVAGASLPILAGLVDKSLLRVTDSGRYFMHELLRQYALEKLEKDQRAIVEVQNRHCAYYAHFLEDRGTELKSRAEQLALAQLEAEIQNARAAWDWAAEQGQVVRLSQALEGLCLFYHWRVRLEEGEATCRLAVGRLTDTAMGDASILSAVEGRGTLARILAWHGVFSAGLGHIDQSGRLLEQSMALVSDLVASGHDVRAEKAFVLRQLGHQVFGCDWEIARKRFEQSLALYRELGDHWEMANTLNDLGWLATYLGMYGEARERHQEALALRRTLGGPKKIAESLHGLGSMIGLLGYYEDAEGLVRECIAICRRLDDRAGLAVGLNQLGTGLIFFGRFGEGMSMLREAMAICNVLGVRERVAWSTNWLGFGELHLGRYQDARCRAQTVLDFARDTAKPFYMARSLWLLGDVALATQDYQEAQESLQAGVSIYQEYGLPNELVFLLADLAIAACGLGQYSAAQTYVREALQTATDCGSVLSFIPILPATVLLLNGLGEPERAVETYSRALCDAFVANSHWYADVVGRQIDAVAAKLSPELVVAAQQRGRARDLEVMVEELLFEFAQKALV